MSCQSYRIAFVEDQSISRKLQDIKKGPPTGGPRFVAETAYSFGVGSILQLGRDRFELGAQLGAERAGAGDECERDEGGDQAILDGGCAGFVLAETLDKVGHLHVPLPSVTLLCRFSSRTVASSCERAISVALSRLVNKAWRGTVLNKNRTDSIPPEMTPDTVFRRARKQRQCQAAIRLGWPPVPTGKRRCLPEYRAGDGRHGPARPAREGH